MIHGLLRKKNYKHSLAFIKQFFQAYFFFIFRKEPVCQIFFFPYYHTGGAERVHTSIVETVAEKNPVVFITGNSVDDSLFSEFKKNASVLNIYYLLKFDLTEKWLKKKIEQLVEKQNIPEVFGCNSKFYYEIIPMLPAKVNCMDLIHAFVHPDEDGPEKWSLPVVSLLSKRIVVSKKTIDDFRKQYAENNIDSILLNRVKCITNFVEVKPFVKKQMDKKLQVLYVGRGGMEKRIYLISNAARLAHEKQLPVTFHFVGDVKNAIPESDLNFCILHGSKSSESLLKFYEEAHLLVITSAREGFPMVIMEAMMHGLVPVSTMVGGIDEHISNFNNGILIEENKSGKIVEKILETVNYFISNPEQLKKMAENAYQYALTHFKKEEFFSSYRNLFNSEKH